MTLDQLQNLVDELRGPWQGVDFGEEGEEMNIRPDRYCPDFEPLTRWQRFKQRWLGIKPERRRLVYKAGNTIVCSTGTYEIIKDQMLIEYQDDGALWTNPFYAPLTITSPKSHLYGISVE